MQLATGTHRQLKDQVALREGPRESQPWKKRLPPRGHLGRDRGGARRRMSAAVAK